ncbi:hypothetical protein HBI56_171410 [Parastagonospora nodorum]|uniref:Zn(2)-C6 fungal-type domain-containing protein n=1 Tax=Phaeosphaeria nodorum (strain SN15 / ATCC MYA-4574 / FGSC 10173) TaxID=321614 RepID=A0A7U2F5V6_PHANO|nr:hypothetical protein HBH56_234230 [Parastagonospora nodorum]QRC97070.1 hypothetical protein JI435_140370 [Parastagonospora nodorum SN15]KAH3921366.1 hypothetical protein HBH54_242290 [Parastagonospora nodorum]KAH3944497.1 hypothetical protein HBH53_157970 [Parastagonospora nodorum]KAH3959395.1 hypothetical protein HBH52_244770 [Parastagonospora nodorum]
MSTSFDRPYRSHKVPACDNCRYRKVRCLLDVPGQACRCCRERNVTCNYVSVGQLAVAEQDQIGTSAKRRRSTHVEAGMRGVRSHMRNSESHHGVTDTSPMESSVMMDPQMAEDITVLEQYLSPKPIESQSMAKPYRTVSTASTNPIVYLTVPRIRKGLKASADPGGTQREIIEQVLSPHAAEVRRLYFDYLHPCFPILDEQTFLHLWQKNNNLVSSTLMCDMYASALLYWHRSEVLRQHPRPDLNFIWNNAITALQDDFLGPTISTVPAALLDMLGRPVRAVTGNIVNAGRVVTLAQSLGLHRDPSSWKITVHEKNVRMRLWWGVVIHDHWSSVGHGIPPTINPRYYDVPPVTSDMLAFPTIPQSCLNSASTFIQLCKLTQILGEVLPHVYALRLDLDELWTCLRKTEYALDNWLADLPPSLIFNRLTSASSVNGSSNLWFAFLSIKLLTCRLAVKATLKETTSSTEIQYCRLVSLREASCATVDFVASLQHAQLQEFWLPYTSYLLVSAATILLRCTIECEDLATKKSCISKLIVFRDRLRTAREESEWDLADFCLERCEEPIQKLADAFQTISYSRQEARTETMASISHDKPIEVGIADYSGDEPIALPDLFLSLDTLEYPWDNLWDTFEASWPA